MKYRAAVEHWPTPSARADGGEAAGFARAVTLTKLVRRAERYGSEQVYEVGERHLDWADLGRLALQLRRTRAA